MVIADTGFWLALANRKDSNHTKAKEAYSSLTEPLLTTWPVLTETCHLLLARLGSEAQLRLIKSYEAGAFQVFDLGPEHAPRLSKLMRAYRNLPMDLADASLVVLAEALGQGRILSTDQRDFGAFRWKNRRPFENLLI